MDCVFVKARKISKALKSNRGSAVNYSKYLTRELQGIDYTDKGNILASGIVGTAENPLDFWQKAEERENQTKRKDSARFAKEYIVGLPHNLPIEEQTELCKIIAEKLSKGGRVVQWVQHEPDKEGDERNFHCHFLMSEREYQNGVFAEKKNRDWNSKKCLADHKKEIGQEINLVLERLQLPKIKIEIEEERETIQDRTESQIRAERAEKKALSRAERKLKLAEVKLNGLGRAERQFTSEPGTVEAEPGREQQSNSAGASKTSNIFEEYKQHRADERAKELERIRIQNARQLAEKQRRELEKNSRGLQRADKDDFSIGR